jgi:hypothetical protein
MGFWFFLTIVVGGNMLLKAYKWRAVHNQTSNNRVKAMLDEQQVMKEKIERLEEAVFLGDFELKRKFRDLERDVSTSLHR